MPRLAPLVAPCREQRSKTAQAGGASPLPPWLTSRPALRARLRAARRAIGAAERPAAAAADRRGTRSPRPARPRTRIAAYQAIDGEIDPSIVLHGAPRARLRRSLSGHHERAQAGACVSRHCGPATCRDRHASPRWLDLVLVPLVGFDARGNRLGMGAGLLRPAFRLPAPPPRLAPAAAGRARIRGPARRSAAPMPHDVPLWRRRHRARHLWQACGAHELLADEVGARGLRHRPPRARAGPQTAGWDGVRNYQARNILRDGFAVGDRAFFHHSSCDVPGIYGTMEVVRAGHPEPSSSTARASTTMRQRPADPRWYQVEVRLLRKFARPVTLTALREHAGAR